MAKKFKGNDRRLLKKQVLVNGALFFRDERAADPAPTKKLSTRSLIFDGAVTVSPAPTTELQVFQKFQDIINAKLAATV